MDKRPLIVIAGPTAVGKSALSVALAGEIGGEIISADSMQVYRKMDIGSDKITKEEMRGIPHYLIDVLDPKEPFHVAMFQQMAKEALEIIYQHQHIPLLVGGTGFYIQALLYDIDFSVPTTLSEENRELLRKLETEDSAALYDRLSMIDELSARDIHPHNRKRILRALEYYYETGEPISIHNARERKRPSPYDFHYFVLSDDRDRIYRQIDRRVEQMMRQGFLSEVKRLKEYGCTAEMTSMQGLGYRELLAYLKGAYSLEEAVSLIKQNTRHFAKRQITWFKKEKHAIWIEKEPFGFENAKILDYMKGYLS